MRRERGGGGGGRQETSPWRHEQQERGEKKQGGERRMGYKQDPFKRKHSEYAQMVSLEVKVEFLACQNTKYRPVQIDA